MPPKTIKTSSPALECKNCHCPLGDEPKVVPFFVDVADHGEASREVFCPPCFVYVRAPLEPFRFSQGLFVPLHCGACGKDAVAVGHLACAQCGARSVVILPPKVAA